MLLFDFIMTDAAQRLRTVVIYLCLGLATAGVYWPIGHFDFAYYDDPEYVILNPHVQQGLTLRSLGWAFTTPLDQWMPVTWLVRIVACRMFGLNAGPQHLINLLVHIVNTLLLFSVLDRMTRAPWRSAVAAALFALHPLHVEPVAWVTGLKDVLSTCFWMLTIGAYIGYVDKLSAFSYQPSAQEAEGRRQKSGVAVKGSPFAAFQSAYRDSQFAIFHSRSSILAYVLTLFLFALGLMSKPMVVTLPFVLLLLDYWPLGRTPWAEPARSVLKLPVNSGRRSTWGLLVKEKIPLFALSAASSVITYHAQRSLGAVTSIGSTSLATRIGNALLSYVRYLGKTVWPTNLTFLYPLDTGLSLAAAVVAALGLIGITALVIGRARREPWLATGWFWYLGTLVPVIGLVQVGVAVSMADRYSYVPLVGLFIMLCWSVPDRLLDNRPKKAAVTVATGVVLAWCAVLCRVQVNYWKDTETLFRHALAVTKRNWIAHNNLGLYLWHTGRTREAIEQYEQALRLRPSYVEAHHNLGLALSREGRLREAVQQFEQVVRLKPDSAEAHRRLGLALRQAGKLEAAIAQFELALWMKPDSPETHNDLGNALLQAGKRRDAIEQYGQALDLDPGLPDAQNNLAWLLATVGPADGGDPVRAVSLARRACELTDNRIAEYLDTLGVAYAATGQFTNAVGAAGKAIELGRAAGQTGLVNEIEARLDLYRRGRAYHPSRVPESGPQTP
jgi:tetratricopeptide (TPR) repeat protein